MAFTTRAPRASNLQTTIAKTSRQRQALLGGRLLEGADKVLTEASVDEAKVELGKIDGVEAMVQTREEWQMVLKLIGKCEAVRQEVDRMLANAQSV